MFQKLSALHAPEGDASGAGDGGLSEESSKDDKDLVPASRLKAALESQERKLRAEFETTLDARLKAVTEKPPEEAEEPKRYSRAELLAAVKAEQITQEQADAEWERSIRDDATAAASRVASETVSTAQLTERIASEIDRYAAAAPEVKKGSGHETRTQVEAEYRSLIGMGSPQTLATQLAALRIVLGPIDSLERAKSGKDSRESHRETGGGGGGDRPGRSFKDTLTERERGHYQKGIDSGRYTDWKAVEEERKYAKPSGYRARA